MSTNEWILWKICDREYSSFFDACLIVGKIDRFSVESIKQNLKEETNFAIFRSGIQPFVEDLVNEFIYYVNSGKNGDLPFDVKLDLAKNFVNSQCVESDEINGFYAGKKAFKIFTKTQSEEVTNVIKNTFHVLFSKRIGRDLVEQPEMNRGIHGCGWIIGTAHLTNVHFLIDPVPVSNRDVDGVESHIWFPEDRALVLSAIAWDQYTDQVLAASCQLAVSRDEAWCIVSEYFKLLIADLETTVGGVEGIAVYFNGNELTMRLYMRVPSKCSQEHMIVAAHSLKCVICDCLKKRRAIPPINVTTHYITGVTDLFDNPFNVKITV